MVGRSDHFAIIVGISRYPGLTTLGGPENDAAAFRDWLVDAAGGDVDPANVKVINSAGFPPVGEPEDPYDANPTDTQFRKALNSLCRAADQSWLPRVGQRLWLFLAGHGFTAGTGSDPSLLTAQAQIGDTAHIAIRRYVERISNAGFFDEIILVMDACQDVMKSATINDPTWTPPDRSNVSTYFGALAAPRGAKSREAPDDNGDYRGFFTGVFLDALRNAPSDDAGWVTAESVRTETINRWTTGNYPARTGVARPPIDAPSGMNIYRRPAPANPRLPGGAGILFGGPSPTGARGDAAALGQVCFDLPAGASSIRVFDHADRQVFSGPIDGPTDLPFGHYTVKTRIGDGIGLAPFVIAASEAPVPVVVPSPVFSSPIPLPGTLTTHEYHEGPTAQLRALLSRQPATPGPGALMVYARDSAHIYGAPWPLAQTAAESIRLCAIDSFSGEEEPTATIADAAGGSLGLVFASLEPGSYALGIKRRISDHWFWQELLLTIAPGTYRTEVFIDCIDDEQSGRRLDLDGAAILIVAANTPDIDDLAYRTEAARLAYADGSVYRGRADDDVIALAGRSPVAGMFIAYAHTLVSDPNIEQIEAICDQLNRGALSRSADVQLLQRWCGWTKGRALEPSSVIVTSPMIARGWDLMKAIDLDFAKPGDTPGLDLQLRIGRWRIASPIWTGTSLGEGRSALAWVSKGDDTPLGTIGHARIPVDPEANGLEQSVRRAILDRMEEVDRVDLDEVAALAASNWNLHRFVATSAVTKVLTPIMRDWIAEEAPVSGAAEGKDGEAVEDRTRNSLRDSSDG